MSDLPLFHPITMSEVRLCVGERKFTAAPESKEAQGITEKC